MATVAEIATLAHGYTLADVERCVRLAMARTRIIGQRMIGFEDRRDAAWHATVELLYSSPEKPEFHELMFAGVDAIMAEVGAHKHHHGRNGKGTGFAKFWEVDEQDEKRPGVLKPERHHVYDFTDGLVDKMALPAVLGTLSDVDYEAIVALAVHGSNKEAAAALGIKPGTLSARVQKARARFLAVWFAPETPRRVAVRSNADDDVRGVCGAGHSRAEHSYINTEGKRTCRICRRNNERRRTARNRPTGVFVERSLDDDAA